MTVPDGSHEAGAVACPRCRTDNPSRHRFCVACGHALQTSCPRCGFVHEPGARFCGGCGQPILVTGPADGRFASPDSYTPWLPVLLCARGVADARSGRVVDALLLEEGVRRASALRILSRHALRLAWLAEGYLLAGRADEAADAADQAVRRDGGADAGRDRGAGGRGRARRSTTPTRWPGPPRSRCARWRRSATLGSASWRAARATGPAKERLTEAVGLLREMDMRFWLPQAEGALRDV